MVVTVHVVNGVQQFVDFQMPPPSCATYATLGFFGSNIWIALIRPDTSPNVKHGAWQPVLACGCGPSGFAAASASTACAPERIPEERDGFRAACGRAPSGCRPSRASPASPLR